MHRETVRDGAWQERSSEPACCRRGATAPSEIATLGWKDVFASTRIYPAIETLNNSGGIPEFLSGERVREVAPYCDVPAMAHAVDQLLRRPPQEAERARMVEPITDKFAFADYVRDLVRLAVLGWGI